MKKITLFLVTVLLTPSVSKAQDFIDNALLFSRYQTAGSARFQAIGGAGTALGGDYSSALVNPAGLGMFNRSEFTFSLGFTDAATNASYFGQNTTDTRGAVNVPGLSYIQKHDYSSGKFLGGAFGASYTRTNNFNTNYQISGVNDRSTLIDFFIDDAVDQFNEFGNLDPFSLSGMAYDPDFDMLLIDVFQDPNNPSNTFVSSRVFPDVFDLGNLTNRQTEISTRKGLQSQFSLSYGGNYDDTFFFGATLGITTIRYINEINYREDQFTFEQDPNYNALDFLSITETFDIQGSGVNLTLGGIYRPLDFLQFGISYVTPTYFNITDSYFASVEADWNNFDYDNNPSTPQLNNTYVDFGMPLVSEYDLRTPARLRLGATAISKFGFATAEVEFVNHKGARYSSNIAGFSYDAENSIIREVYKNAINIRTGVEFRKDQFRIRGGFNHLGNPYQNEGNAKATVTTFSGGLGYRTSKFFVDVTLVNSCWQTERNLYTASTFSPSAVIKQRQNQFVLTLGFPF